MPAASSSYHHSPHQRNTKFGKRRMQKVKHSTKATRHVANKLCTTEIGPCIRKHPRIRIVGSQTHFSPLDIPHNRNRENQRCEDHCSHRKGRRGHELVSSH